MQDREHAKDVWNRVLDNMRKGDVDGHTRYVGETGEVTLVRTSLPKTADGLKAEQIYERYLDNMREKTDHGMFWKLTSNQKELAQAMWRQELALKQSAQEKLDAARAVTVVSESDES